VINPLYNGTLPTKTLQYPIPSAHKPPTMAMCPLNIDAIRVFLRYAIRALSFSGLKSEADLTSMDPFQGDRTGVSASDDDPTGYVENIP